MVRIGTACAGLALGLALASAGCARAQVVGRSELAAQLVDDLRRAHPEVAGIELTAIRGDGCVTVGATDPGDVGDRCDGRERAALRSGQPYVEDPTKGDPVYIVTQQLHDRSGRLAGLFIVDLPPAGGEDRAAVIARAAAMRQALEPRIPSAEALGGTAPASEARAPDYAPHLDPADFVASVTNPWFPLTPGTTYRFQGTGEDTSEVDVVAVTGDTRPVLAIRATVVHDQVFSVGELMEDTYDWYAQDRAGNVWYLGEDTKEYRNGQVVSTEGSWRAGVDGAQAGIVMWGDPAAHVGELYRQEYLAGQAEDAGRVLAVDEEVDVPYGHFSRCVRTEDTTPLEPSVREQKSYCPGVGVVQEIESARAGSVLVGVERP